MAGKRSDDQLVINYLTLRRALGVLGIAFPFLLSAWCCWFGSCTGLQDSISDYYGTESRDGFVGFLVAIALFLYAYKGYDFKDDLARFTACFSALGVAFFPTTSASDLVHTLHFVFATILFVALGCFSFFLFTKTEEGQACTGMKLHRNRVYRTCGVVIFLCIALIAVYILVLDEPDVGPLPAVWLLETIALVAFGVSWIVKGEWLMKDKPGAPPG